jgi:iron complex outermembrane receptor protein
MRPISIILTSIIWLVSPDVSAQENDAVIQSGALDEIIVTATRRESNLQTVPLSVFVVTEEALARLGAASFSDYGRTVPGLTFTDFGVVREKQTIRGISTNTTAERNPTTAMYLDEVPLTNAGGLGAAYNPDPMLIDIERIEVLRGPQGTLFGASAMGGAIRIITHQPNLSQTEGSVGARVSSIKNGGPGYELNGMLNIPLNNGRAAMRVVGYRRDRDGFIDNLTTGVENANNDEVTGGRLSGTILLFDRVGVTGRIVYQNRKSDATNVEDPDVVARTQSRIEEPNGDKWTNYNLVVNAEFAWGNLVSSTSYLDRTIAADLDVSAFLTTFFQVDNPLTTENRGNVEEFVQEVRVLSKGDGQFSWLAGFFYQDQDERFNANFPSPGFDALTGGLASMFGPPDDLFVSRPISTLEQVALYGELSYQLTDNLDFVAGIRWFDINRDFESTSVGLFVQGSSAASGSARETDVTPKFSLSYAASDDLTLYGTAAKGFRSGGVNPLTTTGIPQCDADLAALGFSEFPISYDSDSLWSYELGAKSRWIGGRLQLNAAVYHIDWSDMQTSKLLSCGVAFVENAGSAVSDGIEIEVVSRPTDSVDFTVGASYNVAELEDDAPNLGGFAGDSIPGVPRLAANVGMSYYFSAFGGRDAFVHADYQHVGSSYSDFDRTIRVKLPGYDMVNLRVGLNTEHWSSALFISNLFDKRGILTDINDPILGGHFITATPPRTVGISTNFRF